MLEELYNWLESYSGTSYDFSESFKEIDGDQAFLNPADWHYGMSFILKQLQDACDIIDQFRTAIPENMQNNIVCKRALTQTVIDGIRKNIDDVCNRMMLTHEKVVTIDQCSTMLITLYELIEMIIGTETGEIMKQYDQHEEDNDNSFFNLLNIERDDMTQLSLNVNAIRQSVFDAMEAEELDQLD